jgi:hypothetical protein
MKHRQRPPQPPSVRVQNAATAIAHAVSYGLIHSLQEAIERDRTRGWADENLYVFRLKDVDEVREAWQLFLSRRASIRPTRREGV